MDFGGISGQQLSDLVVQMYNEFTELVNSFQSRGDDPLDITNTVSPADKQIVCCVLVRIDIHMMYGHHAMTQFKFTDFCKKVPK